jgi:hypothetical protein
MRNKRGLVLGVALVLLALVAGSAFAAFGFNAGVRYENVELSGKLYLQIYNSNDFTVRVTVKTDPSHGTVVDVILAPEELKNVPTPSSRAVINGVMKRDRNGYWVQHR